MNLEISKYISSKDYDGFLELIKSEGEEWKDYLNPKYQMPLEKSITYVAYADEKLCGFSRSQSDFGLFIWVIDLLVDKDYRGNSIGKKLLDTIRNEFPDQEIYVMSDNDEYYEKTGYSKEGSIYKIE